MSALKCLLFGQHDYRQYGSSFKGTKEPQMDFTDLYLTPMVCRRCGKRIRKITKEPQPKGDEKP